jgi:Cdc6-like AAA superfamily ATPase
MLRGRLSECATLDGLLAAVRAGESRVLVVRGEPGVGKSAKLGISSRNQLHRALSAAPRTGRSD